MIAPARPIGLILLLIAALLVPVLIGGAGHAAGQAAGQGNTEARAAFTKAEQYWRKGEMRAARIELMNAIKADRKWIEPRLAQAEVLLALGDGVAAQAELDQAIKLGAQRAALRHWLGHALLLQDALDRAQKELTHSDIPPQHQGYAARILANVAMRKGDRELAGQALDRAVRLTPNDVRLWVDIANFRSTGGNQAGAIAAIEKAVALAPNDVAALRARADIMRAQFGLLAAIPWYERAILIDPNNVDLLLAYAATLGDAGRTRDMLTVVRQVMQLSPKNPWGYYYQAVIAARAGEYKLAGRIMLETKGKLDDVPAVILTQGVIAQGDGSYNAAVEAFQRLLAIQPENRRVRTLLARALYLAGDARQVVDLMKGPVNRAEADVYELWVTGQALEALDARAEANQLYNRAAFHRGADDRNFVPETPINVLRAEAERNPGDARTMVPLIRALYDSGQREEAYAQARRLQAANMGAVDAHLLAADTAMGVRNYGAALNALGDARRLRFTEPVMLRIVEAYRALGQRDAAARIVTDFLRYNPASVEGLRWMAVNYLETGQADWALAILQKLKRRVGDHDALLLALLAEAQLGVGEHANAAKTARHAYRLQPSSPAVTYIYGLALLEQEDRRGDARDLLEKAATLVPGNAVFQQAYARVKKRQT